MPPLRTDKAYMQHLRTDTLANLVGKLKNGEMGCVRNENVIVFNNNGNYQKVAMASGLPANANHKAPMFDNVFVNSATSVLTDGGPLATPTVKSFSTFENKGYINLAPATDITSYWELGTSSDSYYKVRVRNSGTVAVNLVNNISTGRDISIPPNTIVSIVYFNNKWWPEIIASDVIKTFEPTFDGFGTSTVSPFLCTYQIINGVVHFHMNAVSDTSTTNQFKITNIPAEIQPSLTKLVLGMVVINDGTEYLGAINVSAGSAEWTIEYQANAGGVQFDNIFVASGVKGIARKFEISYRL